VEVVYTWVNHNRGVVLRVGRVVVPDGATREACLDAVRVATDDPGVILDEDPYDLVAWAIRPAGPGWRAVLLTDHDEGPTALDARGV